MVHNQHSTVKNIVADTEKSLRYMADIIKQNGKEILIQYMITPPQFLALQWLHESGDMTIGELSKKMYLACSTTTDLIDRMEKNNLVIRVKDEYDRRMVRIHILEEGSRIIEEVIDERRRYLSEVLASFSKDEMVMLEKLLVKLYDSMKV
jgi:MarR family transcriptional regulator, organic hydroperoxide resistance regulator